MAVGVFRCVVDCWLAMGARLKPASRGQSKESGLAVVLAEIGDGLEVRHQPAGQPHEFDVSLGFLLTPPARLDSIEVP
jgi:hypothetical protein